MEGHIGLQDLEDMEDLEELIKALGNEEMVQSVDVAAMVRVG